MIVTVSSFPGTETRNVCKLLALQTGLRYVSEDHLMNKIYGSNVDVSKIDLDEEMAKKLNELLQSEAKKNDAIIDHILAAWVLHDAELKVFLHSVKKNRAKKMVDRAKIPLTDALKEIDCLEKRKSQMFLQHYGVDVFDLSVYDLIINVDKLNEEGTVTIIKKFLEKSASKE